MPNSSEVKTSKLKQIDAVAQLCPACGMCCNGVLFGDVELQLGDDARRLTELGLNLSRKGRKRSFNQPCACFDGKLCRIYPDRPIRCQTFECKLLMRVQAGKITPPEALKVILEVKGVVEKVRKIVRELGSTDEDIPLNRRYSAVVAQPIDFAVDDEIVERRSELMLLVSKLARILERDFLT